MADKDWVDRAAARITPHVAIGRLQPTEEIWPFLAGIIREEYEPVREKNEAAVRRLVEAAREYFREMDVPTQAKDVLLIHQRRKELREALLPFKEDK